MRLVLRARTFCLYFFIPAIFAFPSSAETQQEWKLSVQDEGITAYERISPDGEWLSYKGEALIEAPIDTVLYFFKDIERSRKFTPGVKIKHILEEFSKTDRIEYAYIPLTWPFADRYMVYRAKEVFNDGSSVLLTANSTQTNPYKEEENVLGFLKGGRFYLKSVGPKMELTQVTVEVNLDPGGRLPFWLINLYGKNWAGRLLENLKEDIEGFKIKKNIMER